MAPTPCCHGLPICETSQTSPFLPKGSSEGSYEV